MMICSEKRIQFCGNDKFTCAASNQCITMIARTKPTTYPTKALLKYWLSFPLETSNLSAKATKSPGRMEVRNLSNFFNYIQTRD